MAALRSFLRKDYENLIIVDFICRGVNSPKVYRKYIVIIGFTPEGNAVGSLLINSQINHFKRSPELLKHQYCLLHSKYSHILNYDSWLDCSDIFEIPKAKINNKNGKVKGSLDSEDKENVIKLLTESDLFNNALKRRYGILK